MTTKSFEPKNEILKEYIDQYYFSKNDNIEDKPSYLVFPHVKTTISFFTISEHQGLPFGQKKNQKFKSFLITDFKQPILFKDHNFIDEVTIVFKPLGINSFISKLENYFLIGYTKLYLPYDNYPKELLEIVTESDEFIKCSLLENHLLKNFSFFEHPFLYDIIQDLNDNNNISFDEICNKYKITQKTLIKHFNSYIGKTPVQYRTILRFRKAFNYYQTTKKSTNLTELTYLFNYFDQSHLIKDFKKITSYKPKDFFNQITQIEDGKINWIFL
jgi:AraC-like DNA-binding protein